MRGHGAPPWATEWTADTPARAVPCAVQQYEYMVAIATIIAVLAATEWLQGIGLSRLVRRAVRQRERAAAVS